MDDFFCFLNFFGFWVFLIHPTVVSVLLSASVERCFVSHMRDFYGACHHFLVSATEVPEIVHLVFNMELLAISSMCAIGSEHTVCFGAFLRLTKDF